MRTIRELAKFDLYYIYGKNLLGRYCADKLTEINGEKSVKGFIETSPSDSIFEGYRVLKPEDAYKEVYLNKENNIGVVITGRTSYEEMKQKCVDVGFASEQIVFANCLFDYLEIGYSDGIAISDICIWPAINEDCSEKEYGDIFKKIDYFIPDRIQVHIFLDNRDKCNLMVNENMMLHSLYEANHLFELTDYILLRDVQYENELFKRYPQKVRIIDRNFYRDIDLLNWYKLYYSSFDKEGIKKFNSSSQKVFYELKKSYGNCDYCNIICSGPSINEIRELDNFLVFRKGINIVCNDVIRDRTLMDIIKPEVITFMDIAGNCSPCDYALSFYKDLEYCVKKYNSIIIIKESFVPLFLCRFPEWMSRTIGVKEYYEGSYSFLDASLRLKDTSNILTTIMIPTASFVSNTIVFWGCTGNGNEIKENVPWRHEDTIEYDLSDYYEMWPCKKKYRSQQYFFLHGHIS